MDPWLVGFLFGLAIGGMLVLTLCLTVLRRWMVRSYMDRDLNENLIARLAKTDRQKDTYEKALERTSTEVNELRQEKLKRWGIPDDLLE